MEELHHIYTLTDPRFDKVRYVGATKHPARRLIEHLRCARSNKTASVFCSRWIRGLLAAGLKPEMTVIETTTLDQRAEREVYWIAEYKNRGAELTNITDGGDGVCIVNAEDRARISAKAQAARAKSPTYEKWIRRFAEIGREYLANLSAEEKQEIAHKRATVQKAKRAAKKRRIAQNLSERKKREWAALTDETKRARTERYLKFIHLARLTKSPAEKSAIGTKAWETRRKNGKVKPLTMLSRPCDNPACHNIVTREACQFRHRRAYCCDECSRIAHSIAMREQFAARGYTASDETRQKLSQANRDRYAATAPSAQCIRCETETRHRRDGYSTTGFRKLQCTVCGKCHTTTEKRSAPP